MEYVYVPMPDGRLVRAMVRSMSTEVTPNQVATVTLELILTRDEFENPVPRLRNRWGRIRERQDLRSADYLGAAEQEDDGVPTGDPDMQMVLQHPNVNGGAPVPLEGIRVEGSLQIPSEAEERIRADFRRRLEQTRPVVPDLFHEGWFQRLFRSVGRSRGGETSRREGSGV
jgi:hypothetical protein